MLIFILFAVTQPDIFIQNGHADAPSAVAFSPDGRWIVTTAFHAMKVWSATSGLLLDDYALEVLPTHIDFEGERVRLTAEEAVQIVDLKTKKVAAPQHVNRQPAYSDSPDGKWRVEAQLEDSKRIDLIERATGKRTPFTWLPEKQDWVADNEGVYVAQRASVEFRSYATQTGRRFMYKQGSPNALALSPDRRALAIGCREEGIWLFDTGTGVVQKVINERGPFSMMTFSPDGKRLATTSSDQVRIIDIEQGDVVFSLKKTYVDHAPRQVFA